MKTILRNLIFTLFVLASVPAFSGPVNVNKADAATLSTELRGVGMSKAEATRGGVLTDELDENLQSLKVKGLYFVGEVVDESIYKTPTIKRKSILNAFIVSRFEGHRAPFLVLNPNYTKAKALRKLSPRIYPKSAASRVLKHLPHPSITK